MQFSLAIGEEHVEIHLYLVWFLIEFIRFLADMMLELILRGVEVLFDMFDTFCLEVCALFEV